MIGLDSGTKHETIYICFVTSATKILEGIISVERFECQRSGDIDIENETSFRHTDEDQRWSPNVWSFDFLAIPVVDHEHRLVSIVTFDDAVDVLTEEAQEDMSIMAAVQPPKTTFKPASLTLQAPIDVASLLMISGMINGYILSRYESAFVALPVLVTFIPAHWHRRKCRITEQ